jgi:hypothetical protein
MQAQAAAGASPRANVGRVVERARGLISQRRIAR